MDYQGVIYEALGDLWKIIPILVAFHIGYSWNEVQKDILPKFRLLALLGTIALFSFVLGTSLGRHTEDGDPLYGGGYTVVDFQTTENQKYEHALKMFIIFSIPALYGFYKKQ
jgi:hypothetical protein